MSKRDRRIQRTLKALQKALIELIKEQGYDGITIQDIVNRANVGRTTFYQHYRGKDDLFMSCHEAIVNEFYHIHSQPETLLMPEAPPETILAYQNLADARMLLYPIFYGQDSVLILRRIRERSAQAIETNLRIVFAEADSIIPLDLLANYLAGAQIALMQWWLEKHQPYTAQNLAQAFHRLQRAAIRDAFGLENGT